MEDCKINSKKPWANSNAEGWLVVFCGFWLHFVTFLNFSIFMTYIINRQSVSHFYGATWFIWLNTSRMSIPQSCTLSEPLWSDVLIYFCLSIKFFLKVAAIFAIKLKSIWGLKVHLLINSASIVICMILLSFIRNFYGFVIVYLLMFSIPTGFLYVIPITCAWSYFPNKRGMIFFKN